MNQHAEELNTKHPKRPTKLFTTSEFLIGCAIMIGAVFHSQSGVVLFATGKDDADAWDLIHLR